MQKEIRSYLNRVNWTTLDILEAEFLHLDEDAEFYESLVTMEKSGEINIDRSIIHYHGE